ncbi:Ig-like domain-containing protein [Alloiococcus sp. CFN-8]|uniref:Ig-like domain-containing protein n=1 Tax=Alloiococcus sp. CFN-8 TaxID=3416081 RepID=UPI003CF632D1
MKKLNTAFMQAKRIKVLITVFILSFFVIIISQYYLFSQGMLKPIYDSFNIESKKEVVLYAGEEIKLPLKRNVIPSYALAEALNITSDNEEIVSIDESGILRALAIGKTRINVISNKKNMYIDVTVKPIIEIWTEEAMLDLEIGETREIKPRVNIFPDESDIPEITYTISGDPEVLSVNSEGEVTALKEGNADIIIRCGEDQTVVNAKVYPEIRVISLKASSEEFDIYQGDNIKLQLHIVTEPKEALPPKVEYRIIDYIKVIDIKEDGTITAINKGRNIIEVTCGDKIIFVKVNVI